LYELSAVILPVVYCQCYSVRACFGSVILVQLTMPFVATSYECARNHIVDGGRSNVFRILERISA